MESPVKRLAFAACMGLILSVAGCSTEGTGQSSGTNGGGGDTGDDPPAVDTGLDDVTGGGDGGTVPDTGGGGDTDPSEDATNKWADSDRDGVLDRFDNCPETANPDQKDQDDDGVGDACDNFPECSNENQNEGPCTGDQTYIPDRDTDGDGVADVDDNCPETQNPNQNDSDGDGTGDACEKTPTEKFGDLSNDSDGDGLADSEESNQGSSSSNPDSDGDGLLDGTEVAVGTDPTTSDQACGNKQVTAELEKKPIDIIMQVDTTGTMDDEIQAVEGNIKQDFANIIQNSNVDWRLILLANKDAVCIDTLSNNGNCGDGASTNTNRFKHIDQVEDCCKEPEQSWVNFLEYYDGTRGGSGESYDKYLRSNSFKVFVAISDEEEQETWSSSGRKDAAKKWEQRITGKSTADFGTTQDRNFRYHGIVGVPPKSNPRKAYQSSESIQNSGCNGNGNNAEAMAGSEWAAKLSGGLRYPVCETPSYDAVFNALASSVIQESKIDCELDFPSVSSGKELDPDKMALQWKPKGASQASVIHKVHDKANCGPNKFYVENDKVKLCQSFCNTVGNTDEGKLDIFAGCVNCQSSEEVCDYQDNDCDGDVDEGCQGCKPEVCDGEDNDCDGEIDEGCCTKKAVGDSCSMDSECCIGNCRRDGTCGKPCRPLGVSCAEDSQCCSGICGGASGDTLGSCASQ